MRLRHFDINPPWTDDRDAVIVVGSGIAGCLVALEAARSAPVVLITVEDLGAGSTQRAQGGIAAALDGGDSVEAHAADTIAAGGGIGDPRAAARICAAGPGRIAALAARGVGFDRNGDGLALAREGAHSTARVAHAGGDATGAHIVAALTAAVRADPRVEVAEHERAFEILVRDGRVTGLRTIGRDGRERRRRGRAVALATGGSGQLYPRTTNPAAATADGPALAARAGAALADLEFVQFHPTAIDLGESPLALASEALRGEGALLRDAHGHRFMPDEHPLAELGPRDVVARAIARAAAESGGAVTLDLRHLDAETVRRRFPTVAALCAAHGLDLARDPIPVAPAAHYAIGGVLTDLEGRTTLPGLFALGECAATGLHGANRLASNALLEAAATAAWAAEVLAGDEDWPEGPRATPRTPSPPAPSPAGDDGLRAAIQQAMWSGAGVERDAAGLTDAARRLAALDAPWAGADQNLLLVARMTIDAALAREESRGAHFRRDHPSPDPTQACRFAWVGGERHPLPRTLHAPAEEAA